MTTLMMTPGRKTMGFEAYLRDDDGNHVAPAGDGDWHGWVSASRTRNFCNDATLVDWLDAHGREHGFVPDSEIPGYDPEYDFGKYVMEQGPRFESAVIALIAERHDICVIPGGWEAVRSLDAARATYDAMRRAEPLISQAVLWNPADRTYGGADLLIRSDILRELFPEAIPEDEVDIGAPGIDLIRRHYRVIDIKFKNLMLLKDGHASSDLKDYMVQVHIYNQALGRIQGYAPPAAYLLGRSWRQNGDRSDSCMDRLAICRADHVIKSTPVAALASAAVAWRRRLQAEGANWQVLPEPSVPELWPGSEAGLWKTADRVIKESLGDVTLLWQVGQAKRPIAHANGIMDWRDDRFTPELAGVFGVNAGTLAQMREINLLLEGDPLWPARISSAADEWAAPGDLEFYVDFEWSSDVNDDFSCLPRKGGSDVIFMIGCGHVEDGQWQFSCFVADDLSDDAEALTIDAWFEHMRAVTERLAPGTRPRVFHWSAAEDVTLTTSYASARKRHPDRAWPDPNWFDFLNRVMKQEPIVVRGAMAFGLKAVARAMKSHGLIETTWGDSVVDGLGAMVAAWRCAAQATAEGCSLMQVPLMSEIRDYNEVDCKVMMEIVCCLRGRTA